MWLWSIVEQKRLEKTRSLDQMEKLFRQMSSSMLRVSNQPASVLHLWRSLAKVGWSFPRIGDWNLPPIWAWQGPTSLISSWPTAPTPMSAQGAASFGVRKLQVATLANAWPACCAKDTKSWPSSTKSMMSTITTSPRQGSVLHESWIPRVCLKPRDGSFGHTPEN